MAEGPILVCDIPTKIHIKINVIYEKSKEISMDTNGLNCVDKRFTAA